MESLKNFNNSEVSAYYRGEVIDSNSLKDQLRTEIESATKCYLFMDVDGCLIEGGLETGGNKKTLEEWRKDNLDNINEFNEHLALLKNKGISIGLSTGRGLDFSKRLINAFSTSDSEMSLDKNIVEGGLLVYDHSSGEDKVSPVVDEESANLLRDNREKIIKVGEELGGILEEGKFLAVSFNPPEVNGKRSTDDFEELFLNEIDKELKDKLVVTHSSSAVDITPEGVDKMTTLKEMVKEGEIVIFVGDGKNDESSMRDPLVKINLSPNNSHQDIKEMIKTDNKIGILAGKNDIEGINQALNILNKALK